MWSQITKNDSYANMGDINSNQLKGIFYLAQGAAYFFDKPEFYDKVFSFLAYVLIIFKIIIIILGNSEPNSCHCKEFRYFLGHNKCHSYLQPNQKQLNETRLQSQTQLAEKHF